MLNIYDLLSFIKTHRERGDKKCFHGWNDEQILATLCDAFANHEIAVVFNASNTAIQGVCHGIAYKDIKVFHVSNCLTDGSEGVMRSFMVILEKLYPDFKLEGQRYGRIKHYENTEKFKRRLTFK